MPVVGDLPILHAINVNCPEANLAAIAFQIFEAAGEMSREGVSNNGAIVDDQQLFDFRSQVGNGRTKILRCLEDALNTLQAS